jgi:hypothetical protein
MGGSTIGRVLVTWVLVSSVLVVLSVLATPAAAALVTWVT